MTRPSIRTPIAMLVAALVTAGLIATPASGNPLETKTFRPVERTRHALIFEPRSVRADSIRRARVRLHNRRTGASRVKVVRVARVSRTVRRGSHLRIRKAPRAYGRLKIGIATENTGGGSSDPAPTPSAEPPSIWRRSASFEAGLELGTDGWRTYPPYTITRTNEVGGADGSYAAKIDTVGANPNNFDPGACSCPRMKFEDGHIYGPGDDVWISGSWLIRDPQKLAWSRLMNLSHWTATNDPGNWNLGLRVEEPGRMEVSARRYDGTSGKSVLWGPAPIPANRWFTVDVHFKLSPTDGHALTEVYLDGKLVGASTRHNMYEPTPLLFFNAGLPYFWPGNGRTTVYFDAPRLAP
jgi:hypothetical protein